MAENIGGQFAQLGQAIGNIPLSAAKGEFAALRSQREEDEAEAKRLDPVRLMGMSFAKSAQAQQDGNFKLAKQYLDEGDAYGALVQKMKTFSATVTRNSSLGGDFTVTKPNTVKVPVGSWFGRFLPPDTSMMDDKKAAAALTEEYMYDMYPSFRESFGTGGATKSLHEGGFNDIMESIKGAILSGKIYDKDGRLEQNLSVLVEYGRFGDKGKLMNRPRVKPYDISPGPEISSSELAARNAEAKKKKKKVAKTPRGGKPKSSSLKGREGEILNLKSSSKKQVIPEEYREAYAWYKEMKKKNPGHPSLDNMERRLRSAGIDLGGL